MKLIDHFQRWNKWRKHNTNSRLHKFLVLVGLQHSPTMIYYFTKEEERFIKEMFDSILAINREYMDKEFIEDIVEVKYKENIEKLEKNALDKFNNDKEE